MITVSKNDFNILVINPGSTSTKLGYFSDGEFKDITTLSVNKSIDKKTTIFDQLDYRYQTVLDYMESQGLEKGNVDAIVSRGPSGGSFKSGCYIINQSIIDHCYSYEAPHASTLGPIISQRLSEELEVDAYIYDADGVNEFNEFATLSGSKAFPISPASHTLAQKAVARKYCHDIGMSYDEVNLVVCHIGGGSSTAAHQQGKLVDSTLDGYAPERMGSMPMLGMIDFTRACYSGEYSLNEMISMQMGKGGLVSYLGTSDMQEIEKIIDEGDPEAEYYFNGMVYQQSKDIATMSMVLEGKVDQIIFTGGVANSKRFTSKLKEKVKWIAPISIYPGSYEMESLALGVQNILERKEEAQVYSR